MVVHMLQLTSQYAGCIQTDNKGPVWTSEEHKTLEATLKSFPEENFKISLERYIKLAYELPDKVCGFAE